MRFSVESARRVQAAHPVLSKKANPNKNAVKKFIKPRKNGEKKAPEKKKAKTHFTGKAPLPHSTKKFKPKGRIAWAFSREKRSGKGGRK